MEIKNMKIKVNEIRGLVINEEFELLKYVAPIINLANRFAQATHQRLSVK